MLTCLRCGGSWRPRKVGSDPVQCPRCKRVDWNRGRDAENSMRAGKARGRQVSMASEHGRTDSPGNRPSGCPERMP